MNRYQFEDLISKYLENELPFSQRKEFEDFLIKEPNAKEKVDQIRENIKLVSTIDKVKVSDGFNEQLMKKIKNSSKKSFISTPYNDGLFFGFKLYNFLLFIGLTICSIFLGNELYIETFKKDSNKPIILGQNKTIKSNDTFNSGKTEYEKDHSDSLKSIKKKKTNYSDKIILVND